MKVTDAMRRKALEAADYALEGGSVEDCALAAVEAVLRDIPEWPDPRNGLVPDRAFLQAQARAIAAEDKLMAVRAALVEHSPSKALAILDGG